MGCELCSNENRQNRSVSLSNKDNMPQIKTIENEINDNNTYLHDTCLTGLEERLNQKYSIPQKSTIETRDNKNIINYTQNIVNNNIIQYESRNKHISEKEQSIINSILKEKSDFASMEFNNIFNRREENNKLTENNSNINSSNDINKKNKRKHKHHKHSHTHSSKTDENNTKSSHSLEKQKKEKAIKNVEINENNDNSNKKSNDDINYLPPKQIEKNIKSLLKEINYSKIDKIIEKTPDRAGTTLENLIKYFQKKSKKLSEVEKAWLIYKWITLNIEYDFAGVNNKNYDISEEATLKRGKTICSGYSNLYKKICDNLELIVEIIGGYSKGFNFELTDKFEQSESHAWNAVKINGEWYFVETTWGAGYSEDHKTFIKKFTDYYFFTPPIQFVRAHFPNEIKWQLLPKNELVDQKKFMEFVNLKDNFYHLGFESIDPDLTFNHANEKGNFKIFFDNNEISVNKIKVMAKLQLIKNKNNLKEIENSTLIIKNQNFLEINYLLNKKGKYKLQIFGAKVEKEKYDELFSLIIISEKDSLNPLIYPKFYGLYNSSDMQIIEPLSGILYNGDRINFKIKTSTYTNLFIGIKNNGANNFTELEKHGDIFEEDDILIYGQKVVISTKKSGEDLYDTIIEYNVQINPNKNNNIITFPETFGGPKNKLIEPICNNLKKGEKITFKIKSPIIEEMVVFDGDKDYILNKKEDLFYGTFQIIGENNLVQIGYKKEGNNYGILYKYNVL